MYDILIIGGGAAGFFAAIQMAEDNPQLKLVLLERGKDVLTKVKISGGGRCNVTHAEFDPGQLVFNYPRGEKELLGPFHTFCSGDTIAFFEKRGIALKIEDDGRMFPVSNSSQTIIDCFLSEVARLGITVLKNNPVTGIVKTDLGFRVNTTASQYETKKILVATGSNPKIWKMLEHMGHTLVPPVPSLFTFNIKDDRISGIPGVSTQAKVEVVPVIPLGSKANIALKSKSGQQTALEAEGPLLITHWGMSGPAILKLSAWGARVLHDYNYKFTIRVNWLPAYHESGVYQQLLKIKEIEAKKTVLRTNAFDLPKRLWSNLVKATGISDGTKWADISKNDLQELSGQLTRAEFSVDGKSTFKEEFVTAGGIDLKDINFKTYESKIVPGIYFAGEVTNIDAITGGFNFQNAWTSGYVAAKAIVGA